MLSALRVVRRAVLAIALVACAGVLAGCYGAPGYALARVSCRSSGPCVAVGVHVYYPCHPTSSTCFFYTQTPWAIRWNGATKTTEIPPGRSAPTTGWGSALTGVSCTATTCLAVGYLGTCDGTACGLGSPGDFATPISDVWSGGGWKEVTPPSKNGTAQLESVSCPPTGACFAVGYYENGLTLTALAYRWDGSWSIQPAPSPGSFARLDDVSCSSATSCTAVGVSSNGTLAEHWNGTKWTLQGTPNPSGGSNPALTSVSCVPSGVCTAVGQYTTSDGEAVLAERWNGTTWRIQPAPSPNAGNIQVTGVSCATGSACMAVGTSVPSVSNPGPDSPFAEQWTAAGGWSILSTPTVAEQNTELAGVSCSAATACVAVGSSDVDSSSTFVVRWDGTSWTIQ
jgi:hypothetical protein